MHCDAAWHEPQIAHGTFCEVIASSAVTILSTDHHGVSESRSPQSDGEAGYLFLHVVVRMYCRHRACAVDSHSGSLSPPARATLVSALSWTWRRASRLAAHSLLSSDIASAASKPSVHYSSSTRAKGVASVLLSLPQIILCGFAMTSLVFVAALAPRSVCAARGPFCPSIEKVFYFLKALMKYSDI